jgi:hypothetical protein
MEINYAAIAGNIMTITITVIVVLALYAVKTLKTNVATGTWLATNAARFGIGFIVVLGISVLLQVSPDAAQLVGLLGFNADQSPAGIGIALAGLLIGVTSEPTEGGA